MAYSRGTSANIIVGAAALFTYDGPIGLGVDGKITDAGAATDLIDFDTTASYKDTLTDTSGSGFSNVGYTSNGLELQFQPDFGEVRVDQVLDVAKLYKQGMQVNLNTSFAEATLENLLFAIAGQSTDLVGGELRLSAGDIGECPVERGLVAIGPGTGDCADSSTTERVYVAYRALSIENVSVSAKRDEATMFDVSFRLLPNDNASYGTITDRTWVPA
jgi:hypothetical protein